MTNNDRDALLALADLPANLRRPMQLLREKLANDEDGWRALLPIMEALATPSPQVSGGLPKLPESFARVCDDGYWLIRIAGSERFDVHDTRSGGLSQEVYTADQMRAYAHAALSATHPQARPECRCHEGYGARDCTIHTQADFDAQDVMASARPDGGDAVSHNTARIMLDSLDDFARMTCGVDAKGPRGALERYIAQQENRQSLSTTPQPQGDAKQGWYCARCQCAVPPVEVTYQEAHTECGRIITNDTPQVSGGDQIEPDGYTSYGEFRWACDCDDRMKREWMPVYTQPKPQGLVGGDYRKEFERWVAKRWGCSSEKWADSGKYKYGNTGDWWDCWLAALSATHTQAIQNVKDPATYEDYRDQLAVGNLSPKEPTP